MIPVRRGKFLMFGECINDVSQRRPFPAHGPAGVREPVFRVPLASIHLPRRGRVPADLPQVDVPFPFLRRLLGTECLDLAAGVGLVSIRDRALRLVTLAALVVVAVAALATAATHETREDWRAAARIARAKTTARDTVVVLPARARAAFAYYAPEIRTSGVGRGEGVTVVVAGDPATAVAAARPFVAPPRYALLSEEPAGSRLVVQRWVRP